MRNLSASCVGGLLIGCCLATLVRAEFEPSDWLYRKPVTVPSGDLPLAYITIDGETWDASPGGSLAHLRLVAGLGHARHEIGTVTAQVTDPPDRVERTLQPPVLNLGHRRGETVFYLDLGQQSEQVNRLKIKSTSRNFRRAVRIEGSLDAAKWYTLRDDGSIFDFTADTSARYTEVRFPRSTYRHYRVTITGQGEPLVVTGAVLTLVVPRSKRPAVYTPLTPVNVERKEKGKTTQLTVDLGYRNLPIDRIRLEGAAKNFWRPVRVLVSNAAAAPDDRWSTAGRDVFFSYDTPQYERASEPLRLSRTAHARYVRIEVDNGDNPPIENLRVKIDSLGSRLYFALDDQVRGRTLTLYYGNDRARRPTYDFQQVFARYDQDKAARGELGQQQANPAYAPPPDTRHWTEKHPWVLYVAMILAVAVLGGIAVRVFRSTKPQSPDGPVSGSN
jgi:hypothetical protein